MEAPNYSCREHGEVAGFIGDTTFHTSRAMAQLLSLYQYTQINYQVTDPFLSNRIFFPTLYQMTQYDLFRYMAIVKCLLHFGWNWVGVVAPDDGSGDAELQELTKQMTQFGICIEYILQLSNNKEQNAWKVSNIQKSRAKVVIMCDILLANFVNLLVEENIFKDDLTLILYKLSLDIKRKHNHLFQVLNCSLIFSWPSKFTICKNFLIKGILSSIRYPDPLWEDVRLEDSRCLSSNPHKNKYFEHVYNKSLVNFTDVQRFLSLLSEMKTVNADYSFMAVMQLAEALNIMHLMRSTSEIYGLKKVFPESRCNDRCHPGYRKVTKGRTSACCYDCVRCSEREVSNVTDSENCFLCPDEEWPDKEKVRCLSKAYDFLSYENDALTLIFALASLVFSAMTLFILGIFIHYWNTPVVKANNRTVSFILLTSILLSFLCVFLFLGRPVDITCMLRQVSFGVFFTISVSCVLAKTVTVCIAFKATKPGSFWRKWATIKLSNSLVFTCSFVQVLICIIWLSVSPPYQQYDMFTSPGKINVQCNEGSVFGFYSVLGYMGFLAAVSFLLAFMVRTLPDSFNEAKYITFSMLVFCSVWIAMIPTYLSTRGKHMVAVEVFAILTSTAGILGCIFFPKCYVIFFKHELNFSRNVQSNK
ncbi:vomeronasal type-2 receptor 26-like [Hyperolius riggenbachi]|uniref:vomeronasal type-2 receptor 26-like n=1 Tax=Hyperolius riggenbachi TaxID=752182 RepID=UPI0035A31BBB